VKWWHQNSQIEVVASKFLQRSCGIKILKEKYATICQQQSCGIKILKGKLWQQVSYRKVCFKISTESLWYQYSQKEVVTSKSKKRSCGINISK